MRRVSLICGLAWLFAMTACDSPLQRAKNEALAKLAEQDEALLRTIPMAELALEPQLRGTEALHLDGGCLYVPAPTEIEQTDRWISLEYSRFRAELPKVSGGDTLADFPQSWGSNDLDKLRFICGASRDQIDAATSESQLEQAVAVLTARAIAAPIGAFEKQLWITSGNVEGLLCGDFLGTASMSFCFRPIRDESRTYMITFRRKEEGRHSDVLDFVASIAFEPSANKSE